MRAFHCCRALRAECAPQATGTQALAPFALREWADYRPPVRNSLDVLVQLGLAEKQPDGRQARYELSALGRVYAGRNPDDALLAHLLRGWAPYHTLRRAIVERGVAPHVDGLIDYLRAHHAPYTPHARGPFNPNQTEGLPSPYRVSTLAYFNGLWRGRGRALINAEPVLKDLRESAFICVLAPRPPRPAAGA